MMYLFLLISLLFNDVLTFKTGAVSRMCDEMTPHHESYTQQTSPPPFIISSRPTEEEGVYVVKINGRNNEQFAGFFLQARPNGIGSSIGTFYDLPTIAKNVNCGPYEQSGVTHQNNLKKDSIEVRWESPPDFEGSLSFVATVVANYSTFWPKIPSKSVILQKRETFPNQIATHESKLISYDNCNTGKLCIGTLPNCVLKKNCEIFGTLKHIDGQYEYEMLTNNASYVAMGISEDNKMGADSVLECVLEYSNGQPVVKAYHSYNLPNVKQNKRLEDQSNFQLLNGMLSDGTLYCKIRQQGLIEIEDASFNLDRMPYFVLLSSGSAVTDEKVLFHDKGYVSSETARLLSNLKPIKRKDDFYDGCNTLKNCFGNPDNCVATQDCNVVVSVAAQGSNYEFELKGKTTGYLAVGLSEDNSMGGDSVVECVYDESANNAVRAFMSWNIPDKKKNSRKGVKQNDINLINGSYIDGELYCKFTRAPISVIEGVEFNLREKQYFLLLAVGSSADGKILKQLSNLTNLLNKLFQESKGSNVGYHDTFRTSSSQKKLLADVGEITAASKLLLRLHGAFMIAAWIGSASIGIVLARYFKQTWVNSSLCGKDLWFTWHRFFMLLTWCLTLSGFVLIFVEIGEWVSSNSRIHAILGCITTALCFIQPIGAAFRPHPNTKNRPIFNWLHWCIGNTAHIIGIITIFFAVPLNKAQLPEWLDWILVSFVAVYICVHILLSIFGCVNECNSDKRVSAIPLKDMNQPRSAHSHNSAPERREDAPHAGFRKFVLSLHIILTWLLAIAIIVIIVLAPIEEKWMSLKDKIMNL